ncbi:MAG: tetratricopeptide repeat protein [Elusimicrobia bacterium]|nr:tetratricopeptide repeat protein [Elusimicrobiota bacterium]
MGKRVNSREKGGDIPGRLFDSACELEKKGKYSEAVKELEEAICEGFDEVHARKDMGRIYRKMGMADMAISEFEKAAKLDRSDGEILAELGRIHEGANRLRLAAEKLEDALEKGYVSEDVHTDLGRIYSGLGMDDRAFEEFEKARSMNPDNEKALAGLGRVYRHRKDIDSAENVLRKAIGLNPGNSRLYEALSEVYKEKKDYESAIKVLKEAAGSGISSGSLQKCLRLAYYDKGRSHYRKALKNRAELLGMEYDEKGIDADVAAGGIYACRNEDEEDYAISAAEFRQAASDFSEAARLGMEDERLFRDLGGVYYYMGDYGSAVREFRKAEKIEPSKHVLMRLGLAYQAQGRYDLSFEYIYRFIELDSKDAARENLGISQMRGPKEGERFRVKIIRVPDLIDVADEGDDRLDYSMLLPLSISQITSYLRKNGFDIDQDDLHIRVNYDNRFGPSVDRIGKEIFCETQRILDYANGAQDPAVNSLMERLEKKTELKGYDAILISIPYELHTEASIVFALAFTRYIKDKYNPLIIVGGFDPYMYPLILANSGSIDYIVKGAGEKPLFKMLTALRSGIDISGMPGLKIEDGKLLNDPGEVFPEVPDFTGLPIDKYRYRHNREYGNTDEETKQVLRDFNESGILIAPLIMQQGCPHSCVFCASSFGRLTQIFSPGRAVDYMKEIKDRYDVTGFFLMNKMINISRKYVNEFCDRIIDSGLKVLWSDCARGDNLDRRTLIKMRKAGCVSLVYGLETGSPRMLRYIDKRISPAGLEKILRWTDEAGIWTRLEIICGLPGETEEDFRLSLDFISRNRKYINRIYNNKFFLREGSKLIKYPAKYGIENIFRCEDSGRAGGDMKYLNYGFDEVGGLKWEDKMAQITGRYRRVVEAARLGSEFPDYEDVYFLYYLYSRYGDKSKVVEMYDKVVEAMSAAAARADEPRR